MTDRQPITMNTLYYGDNLKILREYIPTESMDLIYLDPPFNSNRNYYELNRMEASKVAKLARRVATEAKV